MSEVVRTAIVEGADGRHQSATPSVKVAAPYRRHGWRVDAVSEAVPMQRSVRIQVWVREIFS